MSQKYADIIIDISHEAVDRTFQYIIPEELKGVIEVGMQVSVPFGNGKRDRRGYVINITDKPSYDIDKLKSISGVPDKSLAMEGKLIKLAAWMKEKYGSTMYNALKTVMPVKEKVRQTTAKVVDEEYVIEKPPVTELSDNQQTLIEEFERDYCQGQRLTYLLHGVTGSGKTEVYIECIKKVIAQGKQAIVLVPEIALTYQNVARFKQHFGERVAVINSKQSKGEKYREFMKASNLEVDVVIGPRSALFAPCRNLGLIVIDEEHDNAYKSEQAPCYHARETAIERGRLEGASVILGSATPTIESYSFAKLGTYKLWQLTQRPGDAKLSTVSIVDMREELRLGNRSIISKELYDLITDRLEKKEQIMLFLNRRGYNSFVSCRECGEVVKCPRCDVSLSLHNNGFMMCHYCGYIERAPKECPKCKSKYIGGFGTGTEKVEEEINKLFPQAKTLRMDKDTTARKGAYSKILTDFLNHKADILIGTQMIVKGHDFANVTLVGIILADMSLFENDYRSGEQTFDLLTQAAGRAGRGDREGHVLIQTYQPEHYAIKAASKHDYEGFYNMEMDYRRLLRFPPVYNMMVVLMESENQKKLEASSKGIYGELSTFSKGMKTTRAIGPSDATISKINNVYRRLIYIKSGDEKELKLVMDKIQEYNIEGINITMDVNPVRMY
ncbi:MAG: primosomal protein N' [Lachnospiraceae bacterium]|nr:primosomal protein N' [Lachnospiraceae bacterium]